MAGAGNQLGRASRKRCASRDALGKLRRAMMSRHAPLARSSGACLAAVLLLGAAAGCTGIGPHPSQEELKRACDALPSIYARRADLKGILRPDEKEFRILHGEAFTVQRKLPQRVGHALVERVSDKTKVGRWEYDRQIDRYYFYDPDSDRHAKNPPSTNIGNTENLFFHYRSISARLAISCWEYFPVRVIVE
ncbi:hypothetical protein HZY97_00090 [Sphingomonas sp. R-74633]|uniref:hypothetical protein n=1 Tax=Sphingomonas sp. R-74633 TaxID=2751188 RepID=UPI0015D1158B|nr:hypothetical protein [Sphingomonas sp. R-74633]NYT39141.1 hypothetical protein [Sphingomonas sp. R-74633]